MLSSVSRSTLCAFLLTDMTDCRTSMAPCSLPLRTWRSPGTPVRGKTPPLPLSRGGHGGVPSPEPPGEAAWPQPGHTLTSWRVVEYFRIPFSSTKYRWGWRGKRVFFWGGEGSREKPLQPASPTSQIVPGPAGITAPGASSACYLVPALQGPFPLLEQVPLVPLPLLPGAAPRPGLLHHLPALRALWGWGVSVGVSEHQRPPCPQAGTFGTHRGTILKQGEAPKASLAILRSL